MENKKIVDNYKEKQFWLDVLNNGHTPKEILDSFDMSLMKSVIPNIVNKTSEGKKKFIIKSNLCDNEIHEYDSINFFYDGYAEAKRDGKTFYVNYLGEESEQKPIIVEDGSASLGQELAEFAINEREIRDVSTKHFANEKFVNALRKAFELKLYNDEKVGIYSNGDSKEEDLEFFNKVVNKKVSLANKKYVIASKKRLNMEKENNNTI